MAARTNARGPLVTGQKAIDNLLKKLPAAVARKVISQAMRESLKPLAQEIRDNAPEVTGAMRRSIKIRVPKGAARGRIRMSITSRAEPGGDGKGASRFHTSFEELGEEGRTGEHFMKDAFRGGGPEAVERCKKLIAAGVQREAWALKRS